MEVKKQIRFKKKFLRKVNMKNKLIVPGLEVHEDITKKQHQEDFTDLDAVCYYSNIPLSELCSSGTLKLKEKDEERLNEVKRDLRKLMDGELDG